MIYWVHAEVMRPSQSNFTIVCLGIQRWDSDLCKTGAFKHQ
jgi:hypothetical protein